MRRGDLDEMSFAFRTKSQTGSAATGYEDIDPNGHRLIAEVSLHKGDVSVVNFGANPTTKAELLGARRKINGKRRTMSLAEAQTVLLTGAAAEKVHTIRFGKRGKAATMSLAEAEEIAGRNRASGSVLVRAERLVDHLDDVEPQRATGRSGGWGPSPALAVLDVWPSGGAAGSIGAAHDQRARIAGQLAALDAQADAIMHPQPSEWPHGCWYGARLNR